METIVLAYICAAIAWVFAFYISYLFIYKNISFKRFILLITIWGAYTHSPLLSAVDMSGLSDIKPYEAIAFYSLTMVTVVGGYAGAYILYELLKSFRSAPTLTSPRFGEGPLRVVAIMTLGEYLRGVMLSILFLGEQSSIGVSDATFSVANALALTPLSRLAYFGHIYYLTFILFLIIIAIFETYSRYRKYIVEKDKKTLPNRTKIEIVVLTNSILKIKCKEIFKITKP